MSMKDAKHDTSHSVEDVDEKSRDKDTSSDTSTEFDFVSYHESNAGRLVVDPEYVQPIRISER